MKSPEALTFMTMNRWIGILLFVVACSESNDVRMQRFLLQGNEMAKNQNFEDAERYFMEALKIDSCFADAWNNLGTLYYNRKKYSEAQEHYSQAIDCRPAYVDAYYNRATTYYELNELYSALRDLEKIANDTSVHFLYGLIYTKMHQFDKAMIAFRKVDTTENQADVMVNLGTLYYYKRDLDSARMYLQNALKIKPEESNAYNALAMVETEAGKYDQASTLVSRALSLKANDPYFINNRGYIFLMRGDLPSALEDINTSIGLDPYNGWAYRNKGAYYLMTGKYDDAIRLLMQAEKLDPFIEKIYYYLGDAYLKKGNRREACLHFKKALERGDISEIQYKKYCD